MGDDLTSNGRSTQCAVPNMPYDIHKMSCCHTDLVKIRAQAMNPATGRPFYSYPSPWSALGIIYRTEGGLKGMYRSVVECDLLMCAARRDQGSVYCQHSRLSALGIFYRTEGGLAGAAWYATVRCVQHVVLEAACDVTELWSAQGVV
jgi:hypothetical protein